MQQRSTPEPQPVRTRRRVFLGLAWYSVAIHRGITRYAHEADWILDGGFVRSPHVITDWKGDGVLIVLDIYPALDKAVRDMGYPVVNIGYSQPTDWHASVCADVQQVGHLAAEHFLARGFRHLAYYHVFASPGDLQHRDAFVQAVKANGLDVHVLGPMAEQFRERGMTSVSHLAYLGDLLAQLPKPLAVFAEYDDRAIAVMNAAMLKGLRVPEQVAVLGADNDELRCPFASVPLSSVDNDEERIGYEAAKLLDQMMDGQPPPAELVRVAPRGVVVRQSTNLLAIPNEHVARALRIIWEQYTQPIDANQVAQQVSRSYPRLHASFVKYVGHSMADELSRRRVEHAQRLLGETDLKLAAVAEASGFGSADRMGRVFMRSLQTTPRDYRLRHRLRQTPTETVTDNVELARPQAKPALLHTAESDTRDTEAVAGDSRKNRGQSGSRAARRLKPSSRHESA